VDAWLWSASDLALQRMIIAHEHTNDVGEWLAGPVGNAHDLSDAAPWLFALEERCALARPCELTQAQRQKVASWLQGDVCWWTGQPTCEVSSMSTSHDEWPSLHWARARLHHAQADPARAADEMAATANVLLQQPWTPHTLMHTWLAQAANQGSTPLRWWLVLGERDDVDVETLIAAATELARARVAGDEVDTVMTRALHARPYDAELSTWYWVRQSCAQTAALADLPTQEALLVLRAERALACGRLVEASMIWSFAEVNGVASSSSWSWPAWQSFVTSLRVPSEVPQGRVDKVRRTIEASARLVATPSARSSFPTGYDLQVKVGDKGSVTWVNVRNEQGHTVLDGDIRLAHIVAQWWRARLASSVATGQTIDVHVELP
jgi:hypothetical protein